MCEWICCFSVIFFFLALTQKKVVEQLRKELLVKQEPELKPQILTASADGKAVLLTPACPPSQLQTGPPHHQGAPQVQFDLFTFFNKNTTLICKCF